MSNDEQQFADYHDDGDTGKKNKKYKKHSHTLFLCSTIN